MIILVLILTLIIIVVVLVLVLLLIIMVINIIIIIIQQIFKRAFLESRVSAEGQRSSENTQPQRKLGKETARRSVLIISIRDISNRGSQISESLLILSLQNALWAHLSRFNFRKLPEVLSSRLANTQPESRPTSAQPFPVSTEVTFGRGDLSVCPPGGCTGAHECLKYF